MQAAFYSFLPTGGAIRVAGHQLYHLRDRFSWRAYLPEGGTPLLPETSVPVSSYAFPAGRSLKGVARIAAPLLLWRKALAYRNLCGRIARDVIVDGSRALLAHSSLIITSPPLLSFPGPPSVYYCHEYPRYIYEKGVHKTGSAVTDLLIAPLLTWEKRVDRQAAQSATILATNSRYMAENLRRVYRRKVVVVPPGVDTDVFTPCQGVRGNYVLTVGALSEFKRHHLVVEALARIPEKHRPPMMTAADRGDEGYTGYLSALALRLGVSLALEREVPDSRLLELYRGAQVVVCPQRNEPYGLVPLEAMACGTPVVAVNQGGFRENVIDGENGLLVPVDAESIAEALLFLFENPCRASIMGATGREFVLSHRSSRVEAETVAKLMDKVSGKS
ncbi:MAG: glycosyltransferase family 4 protein [Candidatus Aegiribacteria sp.]|nr:glycosyltransferase family 4 protein [Candidatus Aegiribacteria sp.]